MSVVMKKRLVIPIFVVLALGLLWAALPSGQSFADDGPPIVCDGSTCYEYVAGPLSWDDAKDAAEAMTHDGFTGHLATITSADENAFIVANLSDAVLHRETEEDPFIGGAWIGGFQPALSTEPGGGWQWVTGEPFDYANWAGGEPNDSGGEDAINFWQGAGAWNDAKGSLLKGYVIEYGEDDEGAPSPPSNQAPDCSDANASPSELWPPNHKMKSITVTGVTDADEDAISINIDTIRQDEAVRGKGSGNTGPDGSGVGSSTAQVRAERSGKGDGRVYVIGFTASDGNGGSCNGTVTVGVPHDQRGASAVNSGATFDSTTG